jgi:PPOX class probable FMN-dependent enzyme
MHTGFSDMITSEKQLREVMGYPVQRVVDKTLSALDEHCRAFIARSPFLLIASADASGNVDVSPKGDPPGFVQVLDDKTLAIPDRPGNRRADTFRNILQNPKVGLFFLIPGNQETLRVSGRARLVRDGWLREQMATRGKTPELAVVVSVEEAFIHCPKCMIRSELWHPEQWPDVSGVPSMARMVIDHAKLSASVEEVQALLDESIRDRLY